MNVAFCPAMFERVVYSEEGQPLTAASPTTRCGEAGCAGSLPSVMNAIVDAPGGKHINMPATPERIWEALNG